MSLHPQAKHLSDFCEVLQIRVFNKEKLNFELSVYSIFNDNRIACLNFLELYAGLVKIIFIVLFVKCCHMLPIIQYKITII